MNETNIRQLMERFLNAETTLEEEQMLYRKDRNENALSLLGFGCMRFSRKGNDIDLEKALILYREAARNGDVEARLRLSQ